MTGKKEARAAGEHGAGVHNQSKPIIPHDHPYRQRLMEDPNLFFRWHPACWSERDRLKRQRATKADVADLQDNICTLQGEIDAMRVPQPAAPGVQLRPTTDAPSVTVPPNIRRAIRRMFGGAGAESWNC